MAKVNRKASEHVNEKTSDLFKRFIQSSTCNLTFSTFLEFCQAANLHYPPSTSDSSNKFEHVSFYPRLKKKIFSSKAKSIFSKIDKHFNGKEYCVDSKAGSSGQKAGEDLKIFIIGSGPCGLRTAIEMSCMGAKVVVVEKSSNFSRNNILHLWPFLIADLKGLGAKKIYDRFCAGSSDHISIRQLQLILLKVSLILGVEIIFNVRFKTLLPPFVDEQNGELTKGWRAEVGPLDHPITNYEFDVIVGADGKRKTLKGFKRKRFHEKLVIGLTVNFINRRTTAEAKVEEISGVAYIFNQEFFKHLYDDTGIDLENIVYYKGETHNFMMTAKKHSLLAKDVLKQDFDEVSKLLLDSNVNEEALKQYAKEAADFSTHHQLPNLEFAFNRYGKADVALFDFTCMYASENAALFREEKGCKLLSCLVGDSLSEPFWPNGTGCARGFFACFDAAWMIKQWSMKRGDDRDCTAELQILAERESIYHLLHRTTPENTVKNYAAYTIDPTSRYINLNKSLVQPHQVVKYYLADRDIGPVTGAEAHESLKANLEDDLPILPGATLSSKESEDDYPEGQSNFEAQGSTITSVEYDASCFTTSANQADVVGTGSYGVVRRCYHNGLGNVVIKCIHCGGSIDTASESIDVARKKIRFFTRFKHPHIVQIYGITTWSQCFGIIMEEVKCGNLSDLMVVNNHIKIGWKLRYKILHQLADALNYLHFHNPKKSCVHLDVKPENILLTLNLSVKLADFGSLEIAIATGATSTTTETSSSKQYTPLYTAPERLIDICDAEAKSSMDVYSFAMVCYEVITRQAVFQDVRANVNLLINLIASRGQKPNTKCIDNLEEEVKNQNIADLEIFQQLRSIMEKCWCFEPENRLSMKEVLQRMMKFAGCENPYESDVKSNADLITRTMSQNQKAVVSVDKKVPLKLHFPPFYQVAHLVA